MSATTRLPLLGDTFNVSPHSRRFSNEATRVPRYRRANHKKVRRSVHFAEGDGLSSGGSSERSGDDIIAHLSDDPGISLQVPALGSPATLRKLANEAEETAAVTSKSPRERSRREEESAPRPSQILPNGVMLLNAADSEALEGADNPHARFLLFEKSHNTSHKRTATEPLPSISRSNARGYSRRAQESAMGTPRAPAIRRRNIIMPMPTKVGRSDDDVSIA